MSLTASSETELMIDGEAVALSLRPHPRARRLRLRYDPLTDRLTLTLPPRYALRKGTAWAAEQAAWIRAQRVKRAPIHRVGPGVSMPWQGGDLLIDWQARHPRSPRLVEDRLELGGLESAVGGRVLRWMRATALADFTARTSDLTTREGLRCTGVAIGDPRGRWGSCTSAGKIRYNWRLIMAPDYVRSALVAHECAHLVHMDHSPAFHALVHRFAGDDEPRSRIWLRAHGRALHRWDFGAGASGGGA